MVSKYKYLISFDKKEWQDISKFVNTKNTELKRSFISSSYKCSTNILKFSLIAKPKRNDEEHAILFLNLVNAMVQSNDVYINFYENDEIQFKGVVDNGGISQAVSTRPEEISMTVYDYTYLLYKNIETSFEFPSDFTTDADGWYFYKNDKNNTGDDIIITLLVMAGFTVNDIDFDKSTPIFESYDSKLYRTCRHIAYDADSPRKYKDLIDTLLHENCRVLTTGHDGKFIIQDMYKMDYTSTPLEQNYRVKDDTFKMSLSTRTENGIKLTWSELNTMERVLLYDANLGGNPKADGTGYEGGLEMDAGSYWPTTSDVEEIFQEYSSSWLDRPYFTKSSRLANDDLSLLSAKNIFWEAYKDSEIKLDEGFPYAYALKAKFRYKNTSTTEKKEFHRFAIYGEALFRYKINDYTYPSEASSPEEYESEFIFNETQAKEYAIFMAKLKNYGIIQYTWSQTKPIEEGSIWHVKPSKTKISSEVLITSVLKKYFGGREYYTVTAQGYGDYTSDFIRKSSTTVGATTGNIGKDGSNGTSVIAEYAKNTSAYIPPEGDTVFMFGDYPMYFLGQPIGVANWSTVSPSPDSLEDNEYIWQRNSK